VVDKVVSKATGRVYARKRIRRRTFGHDSQAQKIYENELHALKKVGDHDHLIKIRATYTDKKYLAMLLEPVADRNLKEFMEHANELTVEGKSQLRTYFGCLAHTIAFLHNLQVLHKDIKPENILLKDGHLVLTDFGTAFDWSNREQSMTRSNAADARTPRYQSPEVASAGEFHRASDIWSLGVVFLEMVTILRGQTLADMDTFLYHHGVRRTAIHDDVDALMKWCEALRTVQDGPSIDCEPLSWVKNMLNLRHTERPTAVDLCEKISLLDGKLCGRCCSGDDDDSDSDIDLSTNTDSSFDVRSPPRLGLGVRAMIQNHDVQSFLPSPSLPGSFPSEAMEENVNDNLGPSDFVPGILQKSRAVKFALKDPPLERKELQSIASEQSGKGFSTSTKNVFRFVKKRSLAVPQDKPIHPGEVLETRPRPFLERDTFKKWLAAMSEMQFFNPKRERENTTPMSHCCATVPTAEAQRISHFLSSLPEKSTEYEDALGDYDFARKVVFRSSTMPAHGTTQIRHSRSQETLLSSSHALGAGTEDCQFAELTSSRLIHHASDGDLRTAHLIPQGSWGEVINDLKAFGSSAAAHTPPSFDEHISAPAPNPSSHETNSNAVENSASSQMATAEVDAARGSVASVSHIHLGPDSAGLIEQMQPMPPILSPANIDLQNPDCPVSGEDASIFNNLPSAGRQNFSSPGSNTSSLPVAANISAFAGHPRLSQFMSETHQQRHGRHWESATVIMDRILQNKSSVAPTSTMTIKSWALVSRRPSILRWHDAVYEYLPSYTARGKVGAVRELLRAGCNPGTKAKPRWAPTYCAIRGASDKHTKCLMALISHGANLNTAHWRNGKSPLHYAIENQPWTGYSTVVYVLLAGKANPNVFDTTGNVPLLMLLAGNSRLPQEKRDAALLLLAPNYDTDINLTVPGTLDNPLHLAIRCKDPHTVDALLEKIKKVDALDSSSPKLVHARNHAGLTPILLAFTIFSFAGEDADEELQIVKLLLQGGANANDQDSAEGNTPLHLVANASQSTIALEMLCRHQANPRISNAAGMTALDLLHRRRDASAALSEVNWYAFAESCLTKTVRNGHHRVPDVSDFLA
jgi:serine/threonine protein kinase/ankyrin repeat protein